MLTVLRYLFKNEDKLAEFSVGVLAAYNAQTYDNATKLYVSRLKKGTEYKYYLLANRALFWKKDARCYR